MLSGQATNQPKTRDGAVEAVRVLKVARDSAVKARVVAAMQLESLVVTAPEPLRSQLLGMKRRQLIAECADFAVDLHALDRPAQAARKAMRALARRWLALHAEVLESDRQIAALVKQAAPRLVASPGIGTQTAAVLLASIGDNPERMRNEAAFAHHCGVAPLPASSGRVVRHRLNPGGDRHANRALYMVVVTRMRIDQRTRDYVARRTAQGLSNREIIRCLKRYVAREVHHLIAHPDPPGG